MDYFNLSTARLNLRPMEKEDVNSWAEFFENNNSLHFLGIEACKTHKEMAEEWIEKQFPRYENENLGLLASIDKATGDIVGVCGIIPREINGKKEYELAYSVKPKYWQKGYASEMTACVKAYAQEKLDIDRIISIIHVDNHPSKKVAQKNGMESTEQTTYLNMPVEVFALGLK
ncbi:Protein N-acetyltransferase, RimJ/RimL family [Lishizhenia tianjinensis]|uniref:Protein N-acetyltransferase, RimJ/RimL family n=1 Tax=Lishizhenia tianjinensis TaxID=477690 RepID=A0A1I6YYY3_9FLAO|nr:GNAT family N-acetyltransferase [Lishizhenia tianjinensis]SFT55679.1 Protein N-acetyltransferase, RimJ/RimL family [Lishizhenia tianjinensis]